MKRGLVLAAIAVVGAALALFVLARPPREPAHHAASDAGVTHTPRPAPVLAEADAGIELPEPRASSIGGRVLDHGKPVAGVTVTLGDQLGGAITDESGTYRIARVRPGVHEVQALDRPSGRRASRAVDVKEGVDEDDVDLQLAASARLRIEVVDLDGRPVAHARVAVWGAAASRSYFDGSGDTDDHGVVERLGLTTGVVSFVIVAGPEKLVDTAMIHADDAKEQVKVVLQAHGGKAISGTVVDDRGEPIEGARVDLGGPSTVVTDRSGRFAFDHLLDATYDLRASVDWLTVKRGVDAGTSGLEIRLARAGAITGTARGFGDKARLELEPVAAPGDQENYVLRRNLPLTGETFDQRPLRAGRYRVRVRGDAGVAERAVDVRPGETVEIHLVPGPAAIIRGIATSFPAGKPAGSLTCSGGLTHASTDAAGAFQLAGVVPGDVLIACDSATMRGETRVTARPGETIDVRVLVARYSQTPGRTIGAQLVPSPDPGILQFTNVIADGPAATAGIGATDLLMTVDGASAIGPAATAAKGYVLSAPAGQPLTVGVRSKGASYTVDLTITPR